MPKVIIQETDSFVRKLEFHPSTVQNAQRFVDECLARILKIDAWLGESTFRQRIGIIPANPEEASRWRRRALHAKSFLVAERAKAKTWISQQNVPPVVQPVAKPVPQPTTPKHPLKTRTLLRRFLWVVSQVHEGAPDAEKELLSLEQDVKQYLQDTYIDPNLPASQREEAVKAR